MELIFPLRFPELSCRVKHAKCPTAFCGRDFRWETRFKISLVIIFEAYFSKYHLF